MTIDELTSIVMLADDEKIIARLKELGYRDATTDDKLNLVPLVPVFRGCLFETEDFWNANKTHRYYGTKSIANDVARGIEWIIIERLKYNKKSDSAFTDDIHIYVKEY